MTFRCCTFSVSYLSPFSRNTLEWSHSLGYKTPFHRHFSVLLRLVAVFIHSLAAATLLDPSIVDRGFTRRCFDTWLVGSCLPSYRLSAGNMGITSMHVPWLRFRMSSAIAGPRLPPSGRVHVNTRQSMISSNFACRTDFCRRTFSKNVYCACLEIFIMYSCMCCGRSTTYKSHTKLAIVVHASILRLVLIPLHTYACTPTTYTCLNTKRDLRRCRVLILELCEREISFFF
jgi:hypothetical protein